MSDHVGAGLIHDSLPGSVSHLIADGGCDSDRFRAALKAKGITPCIPPVKSRKRPLPYDKTLYKTRHKIENLFTKFKDWRSAFMQMGQAVQTVWVPQRDILPSPLYPPHYRFG